MNTGIDFANLTPEQREELINQNPGLIDQLQGMETQEEVQNIAPQDVEAQDIEAQEAVQEAVQEAQPQQEEESQQLKTFRDLKPEQLLDNYFIILGRISELVNIPVDKIYNGIDKINPFDVTLHLVNDNRLELQQFQGMISDIKTVNPKIEGEYEDITNQIKHIREDMRRVLGENTAEPGIENADVYSYNLPMPQVQEFEALRTKMNEYKTKYPALFTNQTMYNYTNKRDSSKPKEVELGATEQNLVDYMTNRIGQLTDEELSRLQGAINREMEKRHAKERQESYEDLENNPFKGRSDEELEQISKIEANKDNPDSITQDAINEEIEKREEQTAEVKTEEIKPEEIQNNETIVEENKQEEVEHVEGEVVEAAQDEFKAPVLASNVMTNEQAADIAFNRDINANAQQEEFKAPVLAANAQEHTGTEIVPIGRNQTENPNIIDGEFKDVTPEAAKSKARRLKSKIARNLVRANDAIMGKEWAKKALFVGGVIGGFATANVPFIWVVPAARVIQFGVNKVDQARQKAVQCWTNKHPNGRIARIANKITENTPPQLKKFKDNCKNIRNKIKNSVLSPIVNGMTVGYLANVIPKNMGTIAHGVETVMGMSR